MCRCVCVCHQIHYSGGAVKAPWRNSLSKAAQLVHAVLGCLSRDVGLESCTFPAVLHKTQQSTYCAPALGIQG